jgi:uncharacterized membrane protein YsdA (DUF1294 family)
LSWPALVLQAVTALNATLLLLPCLLIMLLAGLLGTTAGAPLLRHKAPQPRMLLLLLPT